jgi:hypothetical protein
MKAALSYSLIALLPLAALGTAADLVGSDDNAHPRTLMTVPGRLLLAEDFTASTTGRKHCPLRERFQRLALQR